MLYGRVSAFTLEELKALYRRDKMVAYSVLMPLFIGAHYAGTVFIGRAQAREPPRCDSNKWKQLQMVAAMLWKMLLGRMGFWLRSDPKSEGKCSSPNRL